MNKTLQINPCVHRMSCTLLGRACGADGSKHGGEADVSGKRGGGARCRVGAAPQRHRLPLSLLFWCTAPGPEVTLWSSVVTRVPALTSTFQVEIDGMEGRAQSQGAPAFVTRSGSLP